MSAEVQDIVIFVVGVFLSAFFSGSEAALISIPAKRVKQLMEDGGPRAKAYRSARAEVRAPDLLPPGP